MSERYFVRRSQETKLCRDKLYRTIIKIREYLCHGRYQGWSYNLVDWGLDRGILR